MTTTVTWHSTLHVPTQIVEPGRTTDLTWNGSGQLTQRSELDTTSHSVPYSTNGQTRVWTYGYGTGGLLTSIDGPLSGAGDTVTYAYTSSGFLTSITNEVSHVTTVTAHNARGQPTSFTNPNSVVTDLAYDFQGRLTTVTVNPGGSQAVTTIAYDAVGQITRITRPDGSYLDYVYSNARRLTSVTSNSGEKIEYTHDLMGNITGRTIKASGGTIVFNQTQTFDELGRLLKHIGAYSQETTFAYEKNNNLKTITDPRSGVFSYAYDAVNRLIRETDQVSAQVNYTRDGKGDITTYSDPRSLQTTYVRNGFGDTIRQDNPDSGITDYVRDARGLVTSITDARGVVTNVTYDAAGRMLSKSFPAASAEDVTYTYDSTAGGNLGVGRLTKVEDQSGSSEFKYDARGNVLTETRTIGSSVYTVAYAYDLADRVTEITYPSGRIVTYARDGTGRITGVTTKKDSGSSTVTVASSIVMQPLTNLVTSLTYGNALAESRTYTLDHEITQIEVLDGGTALIDRTYARTDDLNITGISDAVTPPDSQTLGYTPANRLNAASGAYGTFAWTYDGVGNRTAQDHTPIGGSLTSESCTFPGTSNRLSSIIVGSTTTRSFTYDGAGNILTDTRSGTPYIYTYNARNRLATVTSGALIWGYAYNGLEQLVQRELTNAGPDLTHFVHDRFGNVIAESDGTGPSGTTHEYIWLPEAEIAPTFGARAQVDRPLAVVDGVGTMSPVLHLVHVDHLHRPIMMTDGTKASVWSATWQPWGGVHAITGSVSLNARFPGQWFQLEAGLHYNWHRHYDPTLGRFTQPDPIGFVDGPSVYGYARGGPQNYVDPDGQLVWTWPGIRLVIQYTWPYIRPVIFPAIIKVLKTHDPGGAGGGGGNKGAGGGSGGDDCPDDDEYCRNIRRGCIDGCSKILEGYPPRGRSDRFFKCLNRCMAEHGCFPGPGGKWRRKWR